ncbi:hypothetical protein E1091_12320, partial [Micromonospora fluostatini]
MRRGPLLLTAAGACAAAHVAGVLMADPVWRYAEVLAIVLLLAYAVSNGLPAPRWAMPAALAVLLVEAVRTLPADRHAGYGWSTYDPSARIDVPSGFEAGLAASWASLTAVAVLLVVWRRGGWRRRPVVAATVTAVLVTGYAVVRIVDVWLGLGADRRQSAHGTEVADAVLAVG